MSDRRDAYRRRGALQAASRALLAPVVGGVKLWLELPWACGIAGAALLLRLLRRRAA